MQAILPWSETLAVGHAGLDTEHHHLVDLINRVGAHVQAKKDPKELIDLLKSLHRAATEHFQHEDAILREIQSGTYPWPERKQKAEFLKAMATAALVEHIAEHQAMLSDLNTIIAGPVDKLCDGLKAWFVDQVHGCEAQLKALFQAAA
jgi:hemerythrin-like metal-binding protein